MESPRLQSRAFGNLSIDLTGSAADRQTGAVLARIQVQQDFQLCPASTIALDRDSTGSGWSAITMNRTSGNSCTKRTARSMFLPTTW